MMSITPGSGSMGPAPLPGGSDRNGAGTEGTEGFAALLAGVMVPPPPQPVSRTAPVRSGHGALPEGDAIEGEGARSPLGGSGQAASGAEEEGIPLDPRALLLRAGIRTGDAPRPPRGPAFSLAPAGGSESAGVALPASPEEGATPAAPLGTNAGDTAATRSPAGPDVLAATRGEAPRTTDLRGVPPVGRESADPADPRRTVPSGDMEIQERVGTERAPLQTGAAPAQAPAQVALPPLTHPALAALDIPLVELPSAVRPGLDRPGLEGDATTVDMGLPVDRTVARALAAAGLDPADFPALQGSALSTETLESTATGPTLPVTVADRSMTRLDPDFRVRLERVVERLQTEHGIEARFLEGFRPQLRQEHLYAQGRTAPGPVVTWTRNSMHTQGRAADLKLEGGAESYRILHQVAAEEGLRTLGMKDPGHVELPRSPGSGGSGSGASPLPSSTGIPAGVTPGVVPGPQGVARVARVAQVAAPARPGVPAPNIRMIPAAEGGEAPIRVARKAEGGTESAAAHGGETGDIRGDLRSSVPLPEPGLATVRAPVAPGAGMAALDRVAELEELRESAPVGPMRRIDLRDADGQGTRVRIEMKGDVVQTEIRTPDGELARILEPASRELEGALERHGLELGRLKVGRSAEVVAPRDFIHPTVAEPNRGQGGGEDSARQGQQRTPRDGEGAHDQPRHRPRPDHPDREYQP